MWVLGINNTLGKLFLSTFYKPKKANFIVLDNRPKKSQKLIFNFGAKGNETFLVIFCTVFGKRILTHVVVSLIWWRKRRKSPINICLFFTQIEALEAKSKTYHEQLQQQHQQKMHGWLLLLDLTGWPLALTGPPPPAAGAGAALPSGGRPRKLSLLVASFAIVTIPELELEPGLTGLMAMSSMAMLSLICTCKIRVQGIKVEATTFWLTTRRSVSLSFREKQFIFAWKKVCFDFLFVYVIKTSFLIRTKGELHWWHVFIRLTA